MVYLLATGAALANALMSVFQRIGVKDAPKDDTLRLRLIVHAVRQGIWLLGAAMMLVSFVLQALALYQGRLTEVQPLLTTELLFLVVILVGWFHLPFGPREWFGALAAAGGLAGFLVFAAPSGGTRLPGPAGWTMVGACCGSVAVVAVVLALRGPSWWRAAMFGAASAVGFAFTAALTKVVTHYVAADWVSVFGRWETYVLALTGVASVFLAQNAYHAGPVAASQSTIVLLDPLASILIGVALFGDQLRTAWPWGALEAASLLVLCVGAVVLIQSPTIGAVSDQRTRLRSIRAHSDAHPETGCAGHRLPPPIVH